MISKATTQVFPQNLVPFLVIGILFGILLLYNPMLSLAAIVAIGTAYGILRKPELSVYLLVAVMPLDKINFTVLGVHVYLYQLISIAGLVSLSVRLVSRKERFKVTIPGTLMMFYLLVAVISLAGTPQSHTKWGYTYLAHTATYVLLYLLSINLIKRREQIRSMIKILITSSALVAALGIMQFVLFSIGIPFVLFKGQMDFFQTLRPSSTFHESNYFGMYTMYAALFILPLLLLERPREKYFRVVLLAAFFLNFVALLLSGTRSAWFAFLGGLLIFLILEREFMARKIRALVLIALVCAALVLGVVSYSTTRSEDLSLTIANIVNPEFRGGGVRTKTINYALNILEARPLLGKGAGWWGYFFFELNPGLHVGYFCNNIMTDVIVQTGLVGLLVYFLFMCAYLLQMLKGIRKTKNTEMKIWLECSVVGFLGLVFGSLFTHFQQFSTFWMSMGIGMSTLLVTTGMSKRLS